MPSTTKRQQRFFGLQLYKKRHGQKTDVKMSEKQMEEFASNPIARKIKATRRRRVL